MKPSNKIIESVVINHCKRNFEMYNDKYTIMILDHINMPLTHEECDEIYAHIEQGTAVEFVREWYISHRGYETGKLAQQVVAKEIQEYLNVHFFKRPKYFHDKKVFNAVLWFIGNHCEMAMPEDAIIETAREFIESNYK